MGNMSIQYKMPIPTAFEKLNKRQWQGMYTNIQQHLSESCNASYIPVNKEKETYIANAIDRENREIVITVFFKDWHPWDNHPSGARWKNPQQFHDFYKKFISDWGKTWKQKIIVENRIRCPFYNVKPLESNPLPEILQSKGYRSI
tara:strand:+ start:3756 stop:4190 length:435 start_codon:yes stop_codon:yes gene_type:complete